MAQQPDYASRLSIYPLLAECFARYIGWIVDTGPQDLEQSDFICALDENDTERLTLLEERLREACKLLDIERSEFVRSFGFKDELLDHDPARVHDILAEPLFTLDLSSLGFTRIKKLARSIGIDGVKKRNADFYAEYGSLKFVIELKTIRMENRPPPEPGKPLGDAMQPYWWGNMFRSNAVTKIEDKNRRALEQLNNAKAHCKADRSILALYTRRVGPSALMTNQDYISELSYLARQYPQVDHFVCKDYFGALNLYPAL